MENLRSDPKGKKIKKNEVASSICWLDIIVIPSFRKHLLRTYNVLGVTGTMRAIKLAPNFSRIVYKIKTQSN